MYSAMKRNKTSGMEITHRQAQTIEPGEMDKPRHEHR
jgi:hypothetical protein